VEFFTGSRRSVDAPRSRPLGFPGAQALEVKPGQGSGKSLHPTNSSGVRLDFAQCCVQRGIWPRLEVGHRLQRLTVRMNCEMLWRVFLDQPHGSAEQVFQAPLLPLLRGRTVTSMEYRYGPEQRSNVLLPDLLPN
jgi:hypothetical protein